MKTNVLYVTWGEDLLTSGILENQVVNQLIATQRHFPEISYRYLCGMPIFWKRRHKQHTAILEERISRLRRANIQAEIVYYWLPVRARHVAVVMHRLLKPLFFFWFLHIRRALKRNKADIIHARAYTGGVVCAAALGFGCLKTPLVFDTRGLYVDELIQLGFIKDGGWWHRLWQRAERTTYSASAAIVNVSAPFSSYVTAHFNQPGAKIRTIHTSVDTEIFAPSAVEISARETRLKSGVLEIVYCGDLGGSSWHSTASLFQVFTQIKKTFPAASLVIITPAAPTNIQAEVRNILPEADLLLQSVKFARTFNARDTAAIFARRDLAVFSYHDRTENMPQQLSDVVLGSKTGEYLAAGLPVLVNRTAKAASQVIENFQVGMTYDVRDEEAFESMLNTIVKNWMQFSKRARKVGEEHFSAKANGQKYYELYKQLQQPIDQNLF